MILKKHKQMIKTIITIVTLSLLSNMAFAQDWSTLNKKKQTKLGLYLTAEQAYKKVNSNMDKTLFIDIRTPSELNYLGATTLMDAHIPAVFMDTTAWNDKKHRYRREPNKNIVADITKALTKKGLKKSDTVVLICRSGKRSATVANTLADNGYTKVYTVVDGYEGDKLKEGNNKGKRMKNGWKNAGLPWTYSLDKDYMYFTK